MQQKTTSVAINLAINPPGDVVVYINNKTSALHGISYRHGHP